MDPHRLGLVSTRLHYFQLVARAGSIRQVALALNLAPSSVSRVIAQLEQDLGTQLFERAKQRLRLTSAGELLLYRARLSLGELSRACTEVGELQGLHRGTITVALVESVARGLFPAVMGAFWERHPGIAVDIKVVRSAAAAAAIADGDCELAIGFDLRPPRGTQRLAAALIPVGALMRPDHPLAQRAALRMFDLAEEAVILSDTSLTLGTAIEEALAEASAHVGRRVITNSIGTMVALASAGAGISLQARLGVEAEIAEGRLVFVPLVDAKLKPRRLVLVARNRGRLSEAGAALAAMLARAVEVLTEL
ncbi:LysR family transcriptional regulator [Methylobacterium sp. Leaf89]|uniref:LysR family transcriptional regulator n=1 Tax=Methylobacterium sp. Leaf89 TaxID=1736245 RepID=UPI0006F21DDA|nr:LysR family transcriptional regulator [Methylobacterium sp. Leaf89]KQO73593.1 LysR family transcriptional regulator [Methylobacterium sp. Leaf89]